MLEGVEANFLSFAISVFSFVVFSISVIIVYLTFRDNRRFHVQKMLNEIVSEERKLKIKLNEYQEKLRKIKSSSFEKENLWNEHDTLLFNFYEYVSLLVLSGFLPFKETNKYFRRIFVDVYASFVSNKTFFGRDGIERDDYPNLLRLFKAWKIDDLYVKVAYRD